MKRLKNKKAFTLIETLLAIVIVAVVALPLLSVFLQSIKTDQAAKVVLNSNYISQDYIEKLDSTTYPLALQNLPNRMQVEDYYLTAKIEPYGTVNSLFTGTCEYAHLIFYSDNTMMAVMPDGKWKIYSSVPDNISFSVTMGIYTFNCDDSVISGKSDFAYCALLINSMQKNDGILTNVTLGPSCKSVIHCKADQKQDITINGDYELYSNMITGSTSLIHVTTYVYDTAAGINEKGKSESYINIKNW